jgi:RNA polymerase sigma-70 factor (ECF subfamily)
LKGVTTSAPTLCATDALADLVRRAQQSEATALRSLYAMHAGSVARVVHHLLGRDGDVDDVVQETFVDAFDALHQLESPAALRGWLVAIAVRKTHRLLAKRRRRRLFGLHFALTTAPHSDPRQREGADELYDALDRIAPDLRVPWVLHRVEQMTLPDVARACDVSLATIKRRIADADARIQRRLAP